MTAPPLDCPQHDMPMSNYTFETGKMSDEEYQEIHNGPDFTEVTTALTRQKCGIRTFNFRSEVG